MAQKRLYLSCDFETTTDPEDVRVWASCAVDIDSLETVHLSNNIDSLFRYLEDKNTVCFYHNLKYDGEYLLSWLFRNGFKHSDTKRPKTFDTLISDDGQFYSITVYFDRMNKKYKKVVFYDSLKKLPFKVAVIAKTFNLPITKGEIDYDAYRAPDHVLTDDESDYIVRDCKIVAQALKIQFEKGLKRMTNASDAMRNYMEIMTEKRFRYYFPTLPVPLDADIRRAYKGGYVYLKPEYRNKRGFQGLTLDVNSLYPSVMYDRVLPWGYPMYFEGEPNPDEKYNLFIVRLECAFDLKPGHLPTIQLKNNRAFVETEYLTSSDGDIVEMTLTSVDLKLFLEHYDVSSLKYICGWKFKGVSGLFKEYIDYWMHIKETTTGAMRQLAKLMLNSLYGKFATNPKARKKIPYLDEDGIVRYRLGEPEERESVYTAMGAFITAYAREKTIRSAQAVYDRFIYADTDSLHLIGQNEPEGLDIHPTRLGAWKNEGRFKDSKYLRAKTYMETMEHVKPATLKNFALALNQSDDVQRDGDNVVYYITIVTCAGMPDNVKAKVTYDNFRPGSTFDGKLMPKRFPGGVVLMPTTFTIK